MAPCSLIEIFTENKPESLPEILLGKVSVRWEELCNSLSRTGNKKEDRDDVIREFLSWGMENPRVEFDYEYSPVFTFGIKLPVEYLNDLPKELMNCRKGCVELLIDKDGALIVITDEKPSDFEQKLSGGYSNYDVIYMIEEYLREHSKQNLD